MSDQQIECDRFDPWRLDGDAEHEGPVWREHLEGCAQCRGQWHAHQMLVATFADEELPALSTGFEAGLEKKIASAVEIRPLRGWRKAAMIAYIAAALGLFGWALRDVPLPTIDPSAPWVPIATLIAVPLTFMLAIAASRLIPPRRIGDRLKSFAF